MTRKILKVGQLGSFIGNIGDIVNHESFRIWLEFVLGSKIQWQNFLRHVNQKQRLFLHLV